MSEERPQMYIPIDTGDEPLEEFAARFVLAYGQVVNAGEMGLDDWMVGLSRMALGIGMHLELERPERAKRYCNSATGSFRDIQSLVDGIEDAAKGSEDL